MNKKRALITAAMSSNNASKATLNQMIKVALIYNLGDESKGE